MNLSKLKITNNLQEQIAIGRELMETYDLEMVQFITNIYDNFLHRGGYLPVSKDEMLCKATYDYWVYGFTPEQQIYFNLFDKTHEQKKEYMTFRTEYLYYARLNTKADMNTLEDKYEAYKLLKPYFRREMIKLSSHNDYQMYVDFIKRHPQFVMKPLGLSNTKGVEYVDSTKEADKKALFNRMVSVAEKYENDYTIKWSKKDSCVLEELIEQDPEFGIFSPKSLNGIRVPTVRINGEIHVYGAWMKIGVTDEIIVGESRDALMVGVDCETGMLNTNGFYETGEEIERHPLSGIRFKGWQIPKWQEFLAFIKDVAGSMKSTINYVGWDVCLTPKGWVLIEGNYYGQSLWQLVQKRGMAKEFGDLIGWHMDESKFWWQYKIKQIEQSAGLHD